MPAVIAFAYDVVSVRLGAYPTTDALSEDLRQAGWLEDYDPLSWTYKMLAKTGIAREPVDLDLHLVSVAELGCDENTPEEKVYSQAFACGYKLCPAEAGPLLRLRYPHQPQYEWLHMAMEPIEVWHHEDYRYKMTYFLTNRDRGNFGAAPAGGGFLRCNILAFTR